MNVREMHIEVTQALQLVAANRTRKFEAEELDLALNLVQGRFIQSRLRPLRDSSGRITGGFELDQAGTDAIRTLLSIAVQPAYVYSLSQYRVPLPADYSYLIADAAATYRLCGTLPVPTQETVYVVRLQQSLSGKSGPKFYENMSLVFPGKTVAIPGDLPFGHTYIGYADKKDISYLSPLIANLGGWYWERYEDLYFPGSYLQVQKTLPGSTPTLTIDGSAVTPVTSTTLLARTTHLTPGTLVPNRLVSSELARNLLTSSFQKSLPSSPISELIGQSLYVYRDNSFTVSGVQITYIRKPRLISLSLGTDCELAPDFHPTICTLTAEYLSGLMQDEKGTALKGQDLAQRVIL